jgi:hypothetical protein
MSCGLYNNCGYAWGLGYGYGGCGYGLGACGYGLGGCGWGNGCGYGLGGYGYGACGVGCGPAGLGLNYPYYAGCLPQFNTCYPAWGCGGMYYPGYVNDCLPYLNNCSYPWYNQVAASYSPCSLNIRRRKKCD